MLKWQLLKFQSMSDQGSVSTLVSVDERTTADIGTNHPSHTMCDNLAESSEFGPLVLEPFLYI
jgi:hypothetical protein